MGLEQDQSDDEEEVVFAADDGTQQNPEQGTSLASMEGKT